LRSVARLDVRPSAIPGAGLGLFSLKARSAGDPIVDYFGEIIDVKELEVRYPKNNLGVYCLALSKSLYVDAALFRGVGALANASRFGVKPKAKFVVNPRTKS